MAYIIKCTDPFLSVKLTETGREKLSKGLLNFSYWAIGDSEVNYDREELVEDNLTDPALSGASEILRPKDRQPNFKSYVHIDGQDPLNVMNSSNLKVVKIVANNEADERGFFSATTSGYTTLTTSEYIVEQGTTPTSSFVGTNTVAITVTTATTVGDWIMFKFTNTVASTLTPNTNTTPTPNLWYQIETISAGSITVDRLLPTLTGSIDVEYLVYPKGEVYDSFGEGTQSAYWDNGTLAFNSSCNISVDDVPVWNQNNVFAENVIGLSGSTGGSALYENYTKFGSYTYLGTMYPYLNYDLNRPSGDGTDICGGLSSLDLGEKSVAILHYTNRTISNFYGEFFYIDNAHDKTVKLHLPTLMYHRRAFSGSSTGDIMGMDFIASGDVKTIPNSDIEYVDLIEDPILIGSRTPKAVGKVFPQLKIIVVDDEEIVAAMSYKSNRNWTLPSLFANIVQPMGGANSGLVEASKTIYITYGLMNDIGHGPTTPLPCQNYIKLTNETSSSRDVEFRMEEIDLLPYMRKFEDSGYDGLGFYADKFKVMYQIVNSVDDRPNSENWMVADFTSDAITVNPGETIKPTHLENQSPVTNGFRLSSGSTSGATAFVINSILNMPVIASPGNLNFGDERFFYGNIEAYIGATTFKTIFDIRIDTNVFNKTTNPTRSQDPTTLPTNIRVTEFGVYDENKELVVIGKVMSPIELAGGNVIMIEASMDF